MSKTLHTPTPKVSKAAGHAVKLFISYSHLNRYWMKHIATLLNGFQHDARLVNRASLEYVHDWHDNKLTVGDKWDGEIKQKLEEMDIFVPLVSIEFFSSWYIQKVELPRAEVRHGSGEILVVPVILYQVNLREKCPFLHGFPAFPTNDRWWSKYRDRREALGLIDDGLWAAIDEALKRKVAKKP